MQSPHSMTAWGPPGPERVSLEERGKRQVAEPKGSDLLVAPGHFRAQRNRRVPPPGGDSRIEDRLQLLLQGRNAPSRKEAPHE